MNGKEIYQKSNSSNDIHPLRIGKIIKEVSEKQNWQFYTNSNNGMVSIAPSCFWLIMCMNHHTEFNQHDKNENCLWDKLNHYSSLLSS